MAQDNKVVSLKRSRHVDRFSMPAALIRLRDATGKTLKQVLSEFFDNADDALFNMADKAGSNTDQAAYFDAMRELRLRRKSMMVSILQYVSQAFNDIGRFDPAEGSHSLEGIDQDSLSLVDHSELEQRVAIENLITKLRNRYSNTIRLLVARVAHLVPGIKLSERQMPLSPEVICSGLAEACGDLEIDIRAKLVVLKLFDKLLINNLESFYQEANRLLVQEGVLPDMKRPPVGRAAPRESAGGHQGAPERGSQDSEVALNWTAGHAHGGHQATFSELSDLLHRGDAGDAGGGQTSGVAPLDTRALMVRLGEVQRSATNWDATRVLPLTEQLKPVLAADNGAMYSVRQVDSDVINLVSMLFDFILEDRQLPPVMKALIGRLQIPVLKVALSDQNFFNRGGHPARKLLNELAMAGIGWTEKAAGQRDPLREKMESVVDHLLNEFTDNVELFAELLADFSHFMDLDRRRRELVEQRLRDAEEGRARQEQASQAVDALIGETVADREVPEPVSSLLQLPWRKYLQWVVLREGEDSPRWEKAAELTRRLVWSVDPRPVSDSTRSELLRAIPAIVDELREALQEISWDPFATDAAIRDLELAHVDTFQRLVAFRRRPEPGNQPELAEEHDKVSVPAPEASPVDEATPLAEPEFAATAQSAHAPVEPVTDGDTVGDEWLAKADSLRVGSWIELTSDRGKSRCKLAAVIKATGKYIFVNRSGAKVAEYHRGDIARALASGDLVMLDDGLIFDRALESIIDNLRNSRRD